ncbi:MAG: DUF4198 domain-containing protein [Burkholderiales bacterium]|nr:DUF4198 domain-containing protein [Burkholderiales bacterium]
MNRKLGLAAAALAAALYLPGAQAHNFWMLPSSTVMSSPQWITVDAAVANDFFYFNHQPLRLDNLAITAPDGSSVAAENMHRGKLRSVFDVNLAKPGTYRLAVANQALFASYKLNGERKRWRGTAATFAKDIPANAEELDVTESVSRLETFVTVGKPSQLAPTNVGLELVPVTHPNDLVSGEAATFKLQVDGKPAANIEVVMVSGGSRYRDKVGEIKVKTDANGQFSVKWPQPGMYWLDADAEDNKTSMPQAKKRRLAYTATLEVMAQ